MKQISSGAYCPPVLTETFWKRAVRDYRVNKTLYLMVLPVIAFYILFHYAPMYGAIIAFKNYEPHFGIIGELMGRLKHFFDFFRSPYFARVIKNTLTISISELVFSFPAPIILAILINEVRNKSFKRMVQTITYMPHFISIIIICSMITVFTADDGIINDFIAALGGQRVTMLMEPKLFVPVYVASGIWQHMGWNSIIYLAALSAIDSHLYEAAKIDGAGRFKQMLHVTLPGIMPTIIILLILRMGTIFSIGYEKIILLYNPLTYESADVISSYVYRKGIQEFNWSFSTAVGLFNSVINFLFIVTSNKLSRTIGETSLW